jgi:hypothetical protein
VTDPDPADGSSLDPVRQRRAQVARLVSIGQRVGYSLFGVAVVAFGVGFALGFTDAVVLIIEVCLLVGSIVLAPAIVFGYAVKAAERDDREHGR